MAGHREHGRGWQARGPGAALWKATRRGHARGWGRAIPTDYLPPPLPVEPIRDGCPSLPAAAESVAIPSAARPVGE